MEFIQMYYICTILILNYMFINYYLHISHN